MLKFPFIRIGAFIALLPLFLGAFFSFKDHTSLFDEGSGSGAFLWLLIVTLPLGAFISLTGLITAVVRYKKKHR